MSIGTPFIKFSALAVNIKKYRCRLMHKKSYIQCVGQNGFWLCSCPIIYAVLRWYFEFQQPREHQGQKNILCLQKKSVSTKTCLHHFHTYYLNYEETHLLTHTTTLVRGANDTRIEVSKSARPRWSRILFFTYPKTIIDANCTMPNKWMER